MAKDTKSNTNSNRRRGKDDKNKKVFKKVTPQLPKDVTVVDYKDVNLLRKFVSDRGKIRARRVTGLTVQQQRAVATAVRNAREMALLPYASTGR
jgi:small subunit ribosomal protein S18